jgi:hypothetical protein
MDYFGFAKIATIKLYEEVYFELTDIEEISCLILNIFYNSGRA